MDDMEKAWREYNANTRQDPNDDTAYSDRYRAFKAGFEAAQPKWIEIDKVPYDVVLTEQSFDLLIKWEHEGRKRHVECFFDSSEGDWFSPSDETYLGEMSGLIQITHVMLPPQPPEDV